MNTQPLWNFAIYKKLLTASSAIAVAIALTACGGGDNPCGSKSQAFSVGFDLRAFDIKIGVPVEIKSTTSPESCRQDITYSVKNGSLPPGMSLINGNVVGTPTLAGTFQFQVFIDAISGYEAVSSFSPPRSALITVTVMPSAKLAL